MSDNVFFISGGGTGGHIYPAFTVVEELLNENPDNRIYFIGNPKNLEFEISKQYPQVTFLPVNVSGMPRKINISLFKWVIELFFAWLKALSYIKKYKPNAIFTTGGYVSAPIVLAAITANKPYMIHDCDSIPGLVSKMAAPKAKIVSVAFENSKKLLKSKNIIFNGNPVRKAFFDISKQEAREKLNLSPNKKVILIMGGSQGAKTINEATVKLLKTLTLDYNVSIIFQTGKKNINEVLKQLETIYPEYKNNPDITVKPYFDEMVYPMKAADITVARAGSLSLSEILQCNLVSILIPYPHAAQDHQRKNAKEMCNNGVALYLEDDECNDENLLAKIKELLSDSDKLAKMQNKTKEYSKNNPTVNIVNQLKSIIK